MIERSLREALAHLPRVVVFVELARHGSFRATAKALGLSPSTVTHHLQVLEAALGVRLVERTSRAMSLTAAGQALLKESEGMVQMWKRGSASARAYAASPIGNLVVTAPDVVAERFVVPAIRILAERHPLVEIDLRVSTANLDLHAEGVDVAIRIGVLRDSGYGVRVLQRGRRGIVATPELAAAWPADEPGDLDGAPWVLFSRHPEQLQLHGPSGATHLLRGHGRIRTTAARSYIGLITAGTGFGLVPRPLIRPEISDGRLVVLLPEWSFGSADVYALTPSPRATDVKVRLFTDILVELFQQTS